MNIKKMTMSAILIAIGFLLHQITPGIPFLGGMKMDFLLVMLFFSIFMMDSYKEVLAVSLVCGIISAMTTTFPGGQVANLFDKVITGAVVYQVNVLLGQKMKSVYRVSLIGLFGTILSGSVFLSVGLLVSGAPISFTSLFIGIVLPTSILNAILAVFMDKVLDRAGYGRFVKSARIS